MVQGRWPCVCQLCYNAGCAFSGLKHRRLAVCLHMCLHKVSGRARVLNGRCGPVQHPIPHWLGQADPPVPGASPQGEGHSEQEQGPDAGVQQLHSSAAPFQLLAFDKMTCADCACAAERILQRGQDAAQLPQGVRCSILTHDAGRLHGPRCAQGQVCRTDWLVCLRALIERGN